MKRTQNKFGGLGDPMPPIKIDKGKGILRLLLNPEGFARSIFQENRKGGVFSHCVIRPGLENLLKRLQSN